MILGLSNVKYFDNNILLLGYVIILVLVNIEFVNVKVDIVFFVVCGKYLFFDMLSGMVEVFVGCVMFSYY